MSRCLGAYTSDDKPNMAESYLTLTMEEFLASVAAKQPAPGGGGVAAITTAAAAGLVAMAARFAPGSMADSADVVRAADRLREEAMQLVDADADAYGAVLQAYALPRTEGDHHRRERIRAALRYAAEVPVEIAAIGANVAQLAVRVLEAGNPNLKGDAYAAAVLALASARSATKLVEINAEVGKLDHELVFQATDALGTASRVADRAAALVDRLNRQRGSVELDGA